MTPPLTIVLTLKGRSAFTYRWMQYMNDVACPYPILIADGGSDSRLETHLRDRGNYPRLDYTYLRYPVDKDFPTFYSKFRDVVGRVSTPYLFFADNDDFILLEEIPQFVGFLEENTGFVSCGGRPVVLRLLSQNGDLVNSPSARSYEATLDQRCKSIVADDGVDRVCYFMNHASPDYLWSTWYQVHRTAAVQDALKFVGTYDFRELVVFEIHILMSLLLAGKFCALPVPAWVCQIGTSESTSAIDAEANLVERFIKQNAFGEIHQSLGSHAPALTESEKDRILKAVARWFAHVAINRYAGGAPKAEEAGIAVNGWWRRAVRVSRPLRMGVRNLVKGPEGGPSIRLPKIERSILDSRQFPGN